MIESEFETPIEFLEYLRTTNLIYRYDTYLDSVYTVADQPVLKIRTLYNQYIDGYDIFFFLMTPMKVKYFNFPEFLEAIENLNLRKLFLFNLDLFL